MKKSYKGITCDNFIKELEKKLTRINQNSPILNKLSPLALALNYNCFGFFNQI